MKKLDFNIIANDSDGKPLKVKEAKEGEAARQDNTIASILKANIDQSSVEKENTMKFFEWAISLREDGTIIVDGQDEELLKKFVDNLQLPVWIKGQLVIAVKKQIETAKSPK